MRGFLLRILVNAAAFYLAALFIPTITYDGPVTLIVAGLALGLINLLIRPLIVLFTLPVNILTLGLFTLVINTWMVLLAGSLVKGLQVQGFWPAFIVSLVISVLNMLLLK